MESFFSRYRNPLVLMAVLFIQIIALATQVKRPENSRTPNAGGTRLVRIWAVGAVTPVERALVATGHFFRDGWNNYVDLHAVRRRNRQLQGEIDRLRMEQARLSQDAEQAHRLQALLGFKEQFASRTVAAQIIGASGSDQSHVIYIDKGSRDGLKPDMPVITPDGIVGKVKEVFPLTAQVLMINDHESGAGVILKKTRLEGILRGSNQGETSISYIMADEKVEPGDEVLTSGGDRIYPKGLPVGTITGVAPDHENPLFLSIQLKPAADLNRMEEVLVITKVDEATPAAGEITGRVRVADIQAQRLPTVPRAPDNAASPPNSAGQANGLAGSSSPAHPGSPLPGTPRPEVPRPERSLREVQGREVQGAAAPSIQPPGQPKSVQQKQDAAGVAGSVVPSKTSESKTPANPVSGAGTPRKPAPKAGKPAGPSGPPQGQETAPAGEKPPRPEAGQSPPDRTENPPQ